MEDWSSKEVLDARSLETQKEGRCGILVFSKGQCSFLRGRKLGSRKTKWLP